MRECSQMTPEGPSAQPPGSDQTYGVVVVTTTNLPTETGGDR